MEKKTKFLQLTFWLGDDESPVFYLVIVEIHGDNPVSALIIKCPKSPIHFYRYPNVLN